MTIVELRPNVRRACLGSDDCLAARVSCASSTSAQYEHTRARLHLVGYTRGAGADSCCEHDASFTEVDSIKIRSHAYTPIPDTRTNRNCN